MTPVDPPDRDSSRREFPTLPIVTPDDDRLSGFQKYGGLYPLGIAGLVVLTGLLAWFAWNVWALRAVWSDVYVLHDASRDEAERVRAAFALGRSADVNQRQLWEIALRRPLPPLARYVVAEGLNADAVADDPRGYGAAVARSEGWPDWLRLILARPLAYAAAIGRPVPVESLTELRRSPVPPLALLAHFAIASAVRGDDESARALRAAAETEGELRPLARDLVRALEARRLEEKLVALDAATLHLRRVPPAADLWRDWEVHAGELRPVKASDDR